MDTSKRSNPGHDPWFDLCRCWVEYYQRMATLMIVAGRMGDHNPPIMEPGERFECKWDTLTDLFEGRPTNEGERL